MPEVTLLYAAFAVVALWLLGELLLQRRAPLHWRALALVGFLVLVVGVAQRSLPLIGAGVLAFGAGQALATRAVKGSEGAAFWSLTAPENVPVVGRLFGGDPAAPATKGRSRRGRPEPVSGAAPPAATGAEPVTGPEPQEGAVEATAVFQADPYAAESDSVYYAPAGEQDQQTPYYAHPAAEQQEPYGETYLDPYAQQYQEYQEYQEYQQYPHYQQYAEPQQQYASYEQQQDYGQQYDTSGYAPYAAYDAGTGVPAQPEPAYEGYAGYDYGQAPAYAQEQHYHAPQG